MGFTWTGALGCPIPLYLICGKRLTNAAMAPAKLKRHLTTNHSHMPSRSADYFQRILESQNNENQAFVSKVVVSENVPEAICLAAEFLASKRKKPHSW
jgi:hypothetical protein